MSFKVILLWLVFAPMFGLTTITFNTYPGYGEVLTETYHYSQSVRIGDFIECAGQGGWDEQGNFDEDLDKQINQAFQNVEYALQSAGGEWSEVFSINSYHDPLSDAALNITLKYIEQYLPDRKPLWNVFGVVNLAIPDMRIEVVVKAYVE